MPDFAGSSAHRVGIGVGGLRGPFALSRMSPRNSWKYGFFGCALISASVFRAPIRGLPYRKVAMGVAILRGKPVGCPCGTGATAAAWPCVIDGDLGAHHVVAQLQAGGSAASK